MSHPAPSGKGTYLRSSAYGCLADTRRPLTGKPAQGQAQTPQQEDQMTATALQAISAELPGPFDSRWHACPASPSTAGGADDGRALKSPDPAERSYHRVAQLGGLGGCGHDMAQKRGTGTPRAAAERRSWMARTGAA